MKSEGDAGGRCDVGMGAVVVGRAHGMNGRAARC